MLLKIGSYMASNSSEQFADHAWLNNVQSIVQLIPRILYRNDRAQSIRDAAGLPIAQIAGIQTGETVGLIATARTPKGFTNINSGAAALALSSSGAGTQYDPYIIENFNFDGSLDSVVIALRWRDTDADYYIKFRNCHFHSSQFAVPIEIDVPTHVEFENCEIAHLHSAGGGNPIRQENGSITLTNTLFSAMVSGTEIIEITGAGVLNMRNVKFDHSAGAWNHDNAASPIIYNGIGAEGLELDIKYIDVDLSGATQGPSALFNTGIAGSTILFTNISNVKWRGGEYFINHDTDAVELVNLNVTHCNVDETVNQNIIVSYCDGFEISYCDFTHTTTGAEKELIAFSYDAGTPNAHCKNGSVHHCKFTKKTGTGGTGNECCKSYVSENVAFHDNWVTECPEDGFSHVWPLGNNHLYNLVIEDAGDKGVALSRTWDIAGWQDYTGTTIPTDKNCRIYNIYGNCQKEGICVEGVRGVVLHDIYIDNSGGMTSDRSNIWVGDYQIGTEYKAQNIFISGPLPLATAQQFAAIDINNATGANVEGRYFDNQSGIGSINQLP